MFENREEGGFAILPREVDRQDFEEGQIDEVFFRSGIEGIASHFRIVGEAKEHLLLHVPYRLPLIPEGEKIADLAKKYQLPFTISGAGSSLLVLYRLDDLGAKERFLSEAQSFLSKEWGYLELQVEKKGATIKEVLL